MSGLGKTRENIATRLDEIFRYYKDIDEEFYEEIETVLITSDVGVSVATDAVAKLKELVKERKTGDPKKIKDLLRDALLPMLGSSGAESYDYPLLILIVGVNGVGKTTVIGKLAHKFKKENKKVLLAAGDTFRAAAGEQLEIWAQRSGADIVRQQEGADPAAVIYDAIHAARARKSDVIICDTAGRLHNKKNLMDELNKIYRVIDREFIGMKRRYLVLDATTGQNAIAQANAFSASIGLDGVILTKLDGTAKGGVVLAVSHTLNLPVRFIGVGEGIEDLQEFDPESFIRAFFIIFLTAPRILRIISL
ncbi:MAG TPA: signal recognition particle-docking protein FtsY [Clostridia bacterium]|nr:signal recognition particle-docking protein FtsY [Clostridia bacterium]